MEPSTTVRLQVGSALPPGDESESRHAIAVWQQLAAFFTDRPLMAPPGVHSEARAYRITLDADAMLAIMNNAVEESGSFSRQLSAHVRDPARTIDTELAVTVASDAGIEEREAYEVATIFLQQLVILVNLVQPGALQLLDTRFTSAGAHRYEAQQFDSCILYGARRAAAHNGWPQLEQPSLEDVWHWLETCQVSHRHTAINDINKVLFTLLKVAEQRQEYSARTVLLVIYQLEVLLDCRRLHSLTQLANRIRRILGPIPEEADCLAELHEVRDRLFVASQPVHRPPLICHDTDSALRELIGQHDTAVESGTAIVLALLHDLIQHGAQSYDFTESFTRR